MIFPERISAPTIGIGSGPDCDGHILATHDLIGTFPWFTPRFAKPRANCAAEIKAAVAAWKNAVGKLEWQLFDAPGVKVLIKIV